MLWKKKEVESKEAPALSKFEAIKMSLKALASKKVEPEDESEEDVVPPLYEVSNGCAIVSMINGDMNNSL